MRQRLNLEERRERRRRVVARSKFALPSTITLISVLCGFSSVVMSINAAGDHPTYYFSWGAGLLVLAGVFDGLDGRIARPPTPPPSSASNWIPWADVLSFGMAPPSWPTGTGSSSWAWPTPPAARRGLGGLVLLRGLRRPAPGPLQRPGGHVDSRSSWGCPSGGGRLRGGRDPVLAHLPHPRAARLPVRRGAVPGGRADGLGGALPQLQEAFVPAPGGPLDHSGPAGHAVPAGDPPGTFLPCPSSPSTCSRPWS